MNPKGFIPSKTVKTKKGLIGVTGWNAEVKKLREEFNRLETQIDVMKKRQKAILRKLKKN